MPKHEYYTRIVEDSFRDFFRNIVCGYPDFNKYLFNCVGSIAFYFRDILENIASEFDMEMGTILSCPMDGLKKYHVNN